MVHGAAYDPSMGLMMMQSPSEAAVDKPFLREPCLAVVEELDYEPIIDSNNGISSSSIGDAMTDNGDSWLYCETPGGYFYKVPITDPASIENLVQGGTLISGVTELNLPPDTVVNEHLGTLEWSHYDEVAPGLLQVDDDNTTSTNQTNHQRQRRRRLAQVTGTKTVLAVRVAAIDQQNTFNETMLRKEVFGTDNTNLKTQFDKCSFGQLIFIPANDRTGKTVSIVGGVVTVTVDHLAGEGDSVIRNAVTTKLKKEFGVSNPSELADHVMYCLPPKSMTGIAYAYINSWLSVYKDVWGLYVSAQMHELGHNLNLAHATDFKFLSHSRARSEYDDKTGLMGYSYDHKEFPKMCFNPAKSWQLKWYRNKEATYVPTCGEVTMKVGGIIDYGQNEVNTVLLQFNQQSLSTDYYLTYNARTLFNRETQEGGNKVVIDAQGGYGLSYSKSTLEARLEVGESFAMRNFNGVTGDTVVVRFIERSGFNNREATITIVWVPDDTSICETDSPTSAPTTQVVTTEPTNAPTGSPTQFPTYGPSASPTSGPSGFPTASPTMKPTGEPSQIPTFSPTSNPTSTPTNFPSASPTSTPSVGPTLTPSFNPTRKPTVQPSLVPTTLASDQPSVRPTKVPSSIPSKGPTLFPTTTASDNPTIDPTKSPSTAPTDTPSTTPTNSPTLEPTIVPSDFPSSRPTSRPSEEVPNPPTRAPTTPPTTMPTTMRTAPSENPSQGPTSKPTPLESEPPSNEPTPTPTMTPSASPTFMPTASPSDSPSTDPTTRPTVLPSTRPTLKPTVTPSTFPTLVPTSWPTLTPSEVPTGRPTVSPTEAPTPLPTFKPTSSPSAFPTLVPTSRPTVMPSKVPTSSPTVSPTGFPTPPPTVKPTLNPSSQPTAPPTVTPSNVPSRKPTSVPSSNPSSSPSVPPTRDPTPVPTVSSPVIDPTDPSCRRWYWFVIPECKGQGI